MAPRRGEGWLTWHGIRLLGPREDAPDLSSRCGAGPHRARSVAGIVFGTGRCRRGPGAEAAVVAADPARGQPRGAAAIPGRARLPRVRAAGARPRGPCVAEGRARAPVRRLPTALP